MRRVKSNTEETIYAIVYAFLSKEHFFNESFDIVAVFVITNNCS